MSTLDSDSVVDEFGTSQAPLVAIGLCTGSSLSASAPSTPSSQAYIPGNTDPIVLFHDNQEPSNFQMHDPLSPTSSVPLTVLNSGAPSLIFDNVGRGYLSFHSLKWRLSSGYFACFLVGWADGVTGTVMPYLDAEFHLTTMTSSLLWAGTACGFFIGTFLIEIILRWLGRFSLERSKKSIIPQSWITFDKRPSFGYSPTQARHSALLIASVVHALYFVMMGSQGGFPVMFVAYALAAFARALLSALLNAYFASGPKYALGFAYGIASLGSFASPLVCQAVVATGVPWFHFYYGSLVLSAINTVLLVFTYKPSSAEFTRDYHRSLYGVTSEQVAVDGSAQTRDTNTEKISTSAVSPTSSVLRFNRKNGKQSTLNQALCMPYQWALSIFALLYCGSETTTQGFMVTYLLRTRYAQPKSVGYVTSGFWAGITLGRFVWGYGNGFLTFTQRKHIIHSCIVLGLVLQVLVWIIKSNVQNSIATAFIGLFYGPIFPGVLGMVNDVLPGEVHMVAMALTNAFASLGGAVFPVVTGMVLSLKGASAFTFVTVPLAAFMAILWGLFPSRASGRSSSV